MGTITVSLDLNGTEYISATKYRVEKYMISSTLQNSPRATPTTVHPINRKHPVTTITLDGFFTDATELDALYEALKTAAVRVATNNTFEMLEDASAVISESVMVVDFKVQSSTDESPNKWDVIMQLLVYE